MSDFKRSGTTASRLREAMVLRGLNQTELVQASGIDKGAVSRYLSGAYEPKSGAISKLAVALNVSEMWLWGYDVPIERTLEQKRNDVLSEIVVRLRNDEKLYNLVVMLADADAEKLDLIEKLVSGLK